MTEQQGFVLRLNQSLNCSSTDVVWLRGACLSVKQGNELPFDNINPLDCRESTSRTEQDNGLLTIPVHMVGGQFGHTKFAILSVNDSLEQAIIIVSSNQVRKLHTWLCRMSRKLFSDSVTA